MWTICARAQAPCPGTSPAFVEPMVFGVPDKIAKRNIIAFYDMLWKGFLYLESSILGYHGWLDDEFNKTVCPAVHIVLTDCTPHCQTEFDVMDTRPGHRSKTCQNGSGPEAHFGTWTKQLVEGREPLRLNMLQVTQPTSCHKLLDNMYASSGTDFGQGRSPFSCLPLVNRRFRNQRWCTSSIALY